MTCASASCGAAAVKASIKSKRIVDVWPFKGC
jgi:hypothetical protein